MTKTEKILEIMMMLNENEFAIDEVYLLLKAREIEPPRRNLSAAELDRQAKIALIQTLGPGIIPFIKKSEEEKNKKRARNIRGRG